MGDTVIATHAQVEVMRSPITRSRTLSSPGATDDAVPGGHRADLTGLEEARRFATTAGESPMPAVLSPDDSWIGRGGLDRKIEIIIRGVECSTRGAGLAP